MENELDREIDRSGTYAVKWEFIQLGDDALHWSHTDKCFGEDRILPMWVADMDFRCPEAVIQALVSRAEHGIFGYTMATDACFKPLVDWEKHRNGWEIQPGWICTSPGVVPALNMLVQTFIAPGEKVLIQTPVYYPFYDAIKNNGAEIVRNRLVYEDGRYHMDFADLEQKARDPKVKMAILCSPHNPVGRVWRRDELARFGEICLEHDILVVSDEIHGDLIYKGNQFTPFAMMSEEFAQHSVTCTAPSKAFNLAGLQTSCIIIPEEELRSRFKQTLRNNGLFGVNVFGLTAMQAAYTHGEAWLEQVLDYVEENYQYLESYVRENIPQIRVIRPEGTYLAWMDCRELGLDKWKLRELMLNEAKVYLDEGYIFGEEGEGFERINIACPRAILKEALERIKNVVERRVGM